MSKEGVLLTEGRLWDWHRRAHTRENSHYKASNYYEKLNYLIGIPATVLSTFAGTSVFVTLSAEVATVFKVIVGCVSVLVAILTGLQTFLSFAEKSKSQLNAGKKWGSLRLDIENFLLYNRTCSEEFRKQRMKELTEQLKKLPEETPQIPQKIFDHEKKAIEEGAKAEQEALLENARLLSPL